MTSFREIAYVQRGVAFAALSGIMWAINGLVAKLITRVVSPWLIAFACSLSNLFFIPWMEWDMSKRYDVIDNVLIILAGLCDAFSLFLAINAYSLTSVGNASAIIFSRPVYCALLSRIYLQEKCAISDFFLLIGNFIGLILITKPVSIFVDDTELSSSDMIGSLAALGGALSGSVAFTSARKLVERELYDPFTVILVKSIIGFVLFGLALCIDLASRQHMHVRSDWLYLFTICFTGVCACVLGYVALKTEKSSTVCAISTIQVVVSYFLQAVFTDDDIDVMTAIGAVLILSAPVWYAVQKFQNHESLETEFKETP